MSYLGLLGLVGLCFGWLVWLSEKLILGAYCAREQSPGGIHSSLKSVGTLRFLVNDDPLPSLVVTRTLFRSGVLVASGGLIALLNETELRLVLKAGIRQIESPSLPFRTLVGAVLILVKRLAPSGWTELIFSGRSSGGFSNWDNSERLSVKNGFHFVMIYPWIRFILWLGNRLSKGLEEGIETENRDWIQVTQKLERQFRLYGQKGKQPVPFLHLPLSTGF